MTYTASAIAVALCAGIVKARWCMIACRRRDLRDFLRDACLAARVLHKGPREPPLQTNHGPLLCAAEPACGCGPPLAGIPCFWN